MASLIDHTKGIPPEILAKILVLALAPDNPPWLLAHICSRWRAIIFSLPELWCSLKIPSGMAVIPSTISLVSAYLERSRQLPLKLTLNAALPQRLLDPLIGQLKRWETVFFHNLDDEAWRTIFATLQSHSTHFSCLNHLVFRSCVRVPENPLGITFPNVTTLQLASSSLDTLKHFSTPHLALLWVHNSVDMSLQHVCSFLQRTSETITHFGWFSCYVPDLELIALLQLLPNLTELRLDWGSATSITDEFLVGLHSQLTVPCVAPKLEWLFLDGVLHGSPDFLVDVLWSRCPNDGNNKIACDPLRFIQLKPCRELDAEVMERFRALADGGIEVIVFEWPPRKFVRFDPPANRRG
ncbi:F-box domain-containing protein [Mycena venus]|uniref:F-box domain-containing protein n=1 Tax=Mycena venus TaxID=2733690 RepID=A0A8H6Y619_9AGAR|nr:F-box domain-containing protein [Mycena venus]